MVQAVSSSWMKPVVCRYCQVLWNSAWTKAAVNASCRVNCPNAPYFGSFYQRHRHPQRSETLEELCYGQETRCVGLGQCPRPVISALRYFREEYETKLLKTQLATLATMEIPGMASINRQTPMIELDVEVFSCQL
jgi:hypothetical protein